MFKAKKRKIILFIASVSIGLFTFFRWQNNSITISQIVFKSDTIPETFKGCKILQISDLHNKEFGSKQNKILAKIEKINPDIIVVTGDLIDSNNTNINTSMELINKAINIAPIYYISGNHEAWSGSYEDLKSELENSGVVVLDNKKIKFFNSSDSIDIIGLADTSFIKSNLLEYDSNIETKNLLNKLTKGSTNFKILLSHRPELFDIYSNSSVNLIFSGHAHGGQFRLPFIGGLVAPDQGFFPKLTEGIHSNNNTSMVISRGLGNSIIPLRIFNKPELIVVTLSK
ncbi:metallophosphoesterase [Romboutsia lituseburensis]|uniref:metallophosphoesterase n=1 Tax=Romboutsia lituseburensis TaxID=1537 RepID=UPI00215A5C54|nr:metallophosphoesterase [Romboutsia lituseburensis]MCR8743701.1 metallophosphoesterase [Romboutsia lituseburensis]